MHVRVRLFVLTLVAVILVACGGGTTGSTDPGSSAASAAPASAAPASDGPASAPPASDAPASTAPEPSSGGTAGGVCDLVTIAELESIFGLSAITTQVFAGPPDTCDIQTDGAPLAAFVLTVDAPSFVFDAYAVDPDSVEVSGIGDKALYNSAQGLFVVLKGSSLVSIAAYPDGKTDEEIADLLKEIAKVAAGRM